MTSVSVLGQTQITIQFDLDRNIDAAAGDVQAAINAAAGSCRRTCRRRRPIYKVNPSDAPILILAVQSDDAAADRRWTTTPTTSWSQQISQIVGRRAGVHRRRAEARGARADRSGQARRHGPDAGRRAHHAGQRHRRCAEGHHRRRRPRPTPSTTTTSSPRPAEYDNVILGLSQRRAGAGARYRPGDRRAGEHAACRPGRTASAASC